MLDDQAKLQVEGVWLLCCSEFLLSSLDSSLTPRFVRLAVFKVSLPAASCQAALQYNQELKGSLGSCDKR